jgi:excisionase family DNA binding protein
MSTVETKETTETIPSPKKMLGIASRFAAYEHALKIEEVAEVLTLSKKTVERMARDGRIDGSFKIGNQVRFDPRKLAEWAKTARGDKRKR